MRLLWTLFIFSNRLCNKHLAYQKIETKMIKCIDCGREFEVDAKDTKSQRCEDCQHEKDKERKREWWNKITN